MELTEGKILSNLDNQLVVDGRPVPTGPQPAQASDLDPDQIAAVMAQTISQAMAEKLLPIQIVNRLLQLRSASGQKLVWTKFDVFQAFAIWSKKLIGETKL